MTLGRHLCLMVCLLAALGLPVAAAAQPAAEQAAPTTSPATTPTLDPFNPISVLENASRALPVNGVAGAPTAPSTSGRDATSATQLSGALAILALLTVLTLAPAVLIMCTSFTRIVVVLSLLRQAIGTQALPPSQVIVGLSLFLTMMVMSPVLKEINDRALQPLQAGTITQAKAWEEAKAPLRGFMFDQIDYAGNWESVYMMMEYRGQDTSNPEELTRADVDLLTLVPAFVLSELKIAFLMGFRLYLPFLVIDMVVSSVLISMGMMMLPPVFISLPFKLLLFVLVDGWRLVAGSLLNSFAF